MSNRREFITLLGGAAGWPLVARAQQPAQIPQVGWIWTGAAAGNPSELAGFRQGLHELGYVEGRNIAVEYRFGENRAERLPEFAADLARLNASVIVAGAGFVTNLSRPGGNITGVSMMRLGGKWPELAKEVLPSLARVGYLINPTLASGVTTLADARRSAEALRIDFRSYPIERPEDLEGAFAAMTRDRIGVLLLDANHPYPTDWPRVAGLALRNKLPAISEVREFVAAGGLMSYGASLFDAARLLAYYMDKILKGAKAGDLPVEQPTKFELAINIKTATALGLEVPPTLLARADEVIE